MSEPTDFSLALCLIMDLRWKDISDETGVDNHLEIEVLNSDKPAMRLIAGADLQFKIIKNSNDLLWGRISSDYYGCWALRNKNSWSVDEMPILPITSAIVEESKSQTDTGKFEFWSKYFSNRPRLAKRNEDV